MEIAPRYDVDPVIALDGRDDDQRETLVRQRRRLVATLEGLDAAGWSTPSRCEGWTAQDVVNHLIVTDGFWTSSIAAGLAGTPSKVLAGFDPKATPAVLADAMRAQSPAESLAQLAEASGALCAAIESLDGDGWRTIAESPPGHVPMRLLAHHALWDGWVHERDILLPLGTTPAEEPDEVRSSLRYAASLGPAFVLAGRPDARGALVVEVAGSEPVVVEVDGVVTVRDGGPIPADAVVLRGTAVDLLEVLSVRAPLAVDVPAEQRWLVEGLADVFESRVA